MKTNSLDTKKPEPVKSEQGEGGKMSPERQRIKIAEACGWTQCDPATYGSDQLYHIKGQGYALWHDMPDYLNDLNAMHEAEKLLGHQQWDEYADFLEDVCGTDGWEIMSTGDKRSIVHATASQRAEAFLRTLGLWEEETR